MCSEIIATCKLISFQLKRFTSELPTEAMSYWNFSNCAKSDLIWHINEVIAPTYMEHDPNRIMYISD